MFKINRTLIRKLILENGGIRPFCTKIGINRQVIYDLDKGSLPDYRTICRISDGLGLDDNQILQMWFVRADPSEE